MYEEKTDHTEVTNGQMNISLDSVEYEVVSGLVS